MDIVVSSSIIDAALALPVAGRVEVLNRLWASLPSDSGREFVSPELLSELERRIALEDANPDDEFSWDEVKANVPRTP